MTPRFRWAPLVVALMLVLGFATRSHAGTIALGLPIALNVSLFALDADSDPRRDQATDLPADGARRVEDVGTPC